MLRRALAGPLLSLALVALAAAITFVPAQSPAFFGVTSFTSRGAPALDAPSATTVRPLDSTPARLLIPSIDLDAKIEPRGLDSKKNLDTAASPDDVAWYDLGPAPGQPGNAIINGHVDWWTGDAVFTHLGRVRVGDIVEVVRADGRMVTFRITNLERVNAGSRLPSLFAPGSRATLTMITCAGVWNPLTFTNTQRLLVSATVVV